ncbi:hypothetical protein FOA52_009979 [Chlamydomonas sp. UWO 241]|nr:hypothetical protein FOA52_009979 [Chlamydomonas sp. UWO 241]
MDVAPGEDELTIDYNNERNVIQPVHMQRAASLATKEFLCKCPRCSAHGDDTRKAKTCGGHHLVHQPTGADAVSLVSCSSCGAAASAAYTAILLEGESAVAAELRTINEIIDRQRLPRRRGCGAPHPAPPLVGCRAAWPCGLH